MQLHDDLLGQMPDGARHDASLCPFCREADSAKQQDQSRASVPSGDQPSGASPITTDPTTEGGTQHMTATEAPAISQETHEALLAKAISDATATTESALERKTNELAELTTKHTALETETASLREEVTRLNKDLDTAQVDLKAARDENASLKADNDAKDEAARLKDIQDKRTDQVKNLKVFPDEYVQEKAEAWAKLPEDEWAGRVDEWTKARPATSGSEGHSQEQASAMSGTSGDLTRDPAGDNDKQPARRAVLGLS